MKYNSKMVSNIRVHRINSIEFDRLVEFHEFFTDELLNKVLKDPLIQTKD